VDWAAPTAAAHRNLDLKLAIRDAGHKPLVIYGDETPSTLSKSIASSDDRQPSTSTTRQSLEMIFSVEAHLIHQR
jgi:hypothetical protein